MARLTFWYEFASTYSYLSAMRIEKDCRSVGVEVVWRPFLLGPIFKAQGWASSPFNIYPAKGTYMWRDVERMIAHYNLPSLVRSDPFPQNGLLAARIATLGESELWVPKFTKAVFDAQFAKGAKIDDPDVLVGLLDDLGEAGLDILKRARNDETVKNRLRQTTTDAQQHGIFGAPSFTTEKGEVFWGDDRLCQAIQWALE